MSLKLQGCNLLQILLYFETPVQLQSHSKNHWKQFNHRVHTDPNPSACLLPSSGEGRICFTPTFMVQQEQQERTITRQAVNNAEHSTQFELICWTVTQVYWNGICPAGRYNTTAHNWEGQLWNLSPPACYTWGLICFLCVCFFLLCHSTPRHQQIVIF